MSGRCMCGDLACPSCGPAQGCDPEHLAAVEALAEDERLPAHVRDDEHALAVVATLVREAADRERAACAAQLRSSWAPRDNLSGRARPAGSAEQVRLARWLEAHLVDEMGLEPVAKLRIRWRCHCGATDSVCAAEGCRYRAPLGWTSECAWSAEEGWGPEHRMVCAGCRRRIAPSLHGVLSHGRVVAWHRVRDEEKLLAAP